MSTPFLRVRPWSFVTCLMCPCRAFYECFCFCFWLYSPKMWGLLRLKYPKKSKTQMSDEKTRKAKKKHSLKPRQGHTKHMCKISGSTSQKRRGHWHLKEFWVLCLNQPVHIRCKHHTWQSTTNTTVLLIWIQQHRQLQDLINLAVRRLLRGRKACCEQRNTPAARKPLAGGTQTPPREGRRRRKKKRYYIPVCTNIT